MLGGFLDGSVACWAREGGIFGGRWRGDAGRLTPVRRLGRWGLGVEFLRRPARWRPGARGATIAVRSLRSGLPRRHRRCRLRRLPSDSLGLIDAPRTPGRHRTGLEQLKLAGRRDGQRAWRSVGDVPGLEAACGARPRSAARAASGDLRCVLRRGDDASRVAGDSRVSGDVGGDHRAWCLTPAETRCLTPADPLRHRGIPTKLSPGCLTPSYCYRLVAAIALLS